MHSARALFLTFLALEKSKRNSTFYKDYATAERGIMPQQCIPKSRDKICSGADKALMGNPIMHSARALFLTFLALEKSKRNSTFYKDYATAELSEGWKKICSGAGDICASSLNTHTTIPIKNSDLQFQTKSLPLKHIQTLNTKVF